MSKKESTIINPFEEKKASLEYKNADPVYEASALAAIEFVNPKEHNAEKGIVVDLGAGTGVSSEIILKELDTNIHVVEPSAAMIEEAKTRIGEKALYQTLRADELSNEYNANIDIIYSLNTFHLFQDLSKSLASIACALRPEGIFVFNLSVPTYAFDELNEIEIDTIKANKIFYEKLAEQVDNEIIKYTIKLLDQILAGNSEQVYTQKKIDMIFSSVNMHLEAYKEVVIKVPNEYQRNIWRMLAKSFIEDEKLIEELINSIELPEVVDIRQAIFKVINNNE